MPSSDPYLLQESAIKEPPTKLWDMLSYIGPGFILSASIVGSGELIATTIVGARAGFILMWFIIFSCLVKVVVQLEFGKHAIGTGESTMASLNTLPGPRLGQANWSIWVWLLLMIAKMMQVGGIVGGVVLALVQFFPAMLLMPYKAIATYAIAASVSLLIYKGYYLLIEKVSLLMIGAFTLFTLASLIALQTTDFAITSGEFASGLIPSIPTETVLLLAAIGAFGITGVGGDEIMAYNYWLIEKGYAKYTGPVNDSRDWERRAKGWIRVMYWDAILAMVAYTCMTVMFYLLGAAVLNRQGLVPAGDELIATLGNMYTESLGPWARNAFICGAIIVLYSTLFAALAAWTRMFADALGRVGCYDFQNLASRRRAIAIAAWVIPVGWATLFLQMKNPALMIILGGLATVVILLIVVYAALHFRYRRLDRRLLPTRLYDFTLWVSSVAIFLVAVYVVYDNVYMPAKKLLSPPTVTDVAE
ncbi:Nramp family divalent metal transporter [Aureliella helgolandensis]|uniref:Manganese transport protein MntH n=1 Tax=Aureliella helgolandensis TaxID=2527968 RepID=A0A518GCJ6_9BACT|nr:Nramp family divalent metal transporter [Aureliella helgolandensis]QDV26293.1 manganese transport protein MntH [Aureliella helgolandensis]